MQQLMWCAWQGAVACNPMSRCTAPGPCVPDACDCTSSSCILHSEFHALRVVQVDVQLAWQQEGDGLTHHAHWGPLTSSSAVSVPALAVQMLTCWVR